MDIEGEITKSFIGSIKAQENTLLQGETNKSKIEKIKKEVIAAGMFWVNNRKHWIEMGNQQGQDAYNAGVEKTKAFAEKKESAALNQAVSLPSNKLIKTNYLPLAKSSQTTRKSPYHQSKSKISSLSKERNQRKIYGERRKRKSYWQGKEPVETSKNRRMKKSISINRKRMLKEYNLEIQEKVSALKTLGIAIPEVHNISNKEICKESMEVLSLGHKFIPSFKPKIKKIINDSMEYFTRANRIRWLFKEDEDNNTLEYWIPSTWKPNSYINHPIIEENLIKLNTELIQINKTKPYNNMSIQQTENLNKLLKDPNIIIITADKNLGYVITSKDWYIQACLDHLNSSSYKEMTEIFYNTNIINETYNTLEEKTKEAFENNIITSEEMKWILQKPKNKPFSPSPFYILPKIHKKPVKGRPIVPSKNWITYYLSKWVANQLNPLVTNICHDVLKDSTDLLQEIKNLNKTGINTAEYYTISADVEALYPSIPPNTGIQMIEKFLNEINWKSLELRSFLLWSLHLILNHTYIIFNKKIYKQIQGAAMGSPCIPPYANIFMNMIERDTVKRFKEPNTLLLYKRFIDDIFAIIKKDNEKIKQLQMDLNNICHNIKLTWTEPSYQTDFLDITIILDHTKSTIETTTYQKNLNKYLYLPYHSFHRPSMKTGFIKGEAIRYTRNCSRKKDFNRMIALFTIRLQRRGYPLSLIKSTLKSIQYSDRNKYLTKKSKPKTIPFIFKMLYNNAIPHHFLRQKLNNFSYQIKSNIPDLPKSLNNKITICYQLPQTLHSKILKNRKDKGL